MFLAYTSMTNAANPATIARSDIGCHRASAKITVADSEVVVRDGTLLQASLTNKEVKATRIAAHRLFSRLRQGQRG